ncbi:MAG: FAD binding domain-containing protein [Chloroflexi bacterium]|nr:FAD binding domain-containing protein [Chloroflexota bacterium]
MPLWKNYYLAQSIPEALTRLNEGARLIAGGTDLLLEIQQGVQPPPESLVDVCNIPELNSLEIRGNDLFIGAAVPLNHIAASQLVQENAQALVEACNLIGGPQVRNTATLGGNVAHALPAADGTIALLALDAQAESISSEGSSISGLEELFLGPRRSTIEANQALLVGFYLPLRKSSQASAFRRVMRPQGVALPVLNIAVWLQRKKDRIADAHLALGPSGPTPLRARMAETVLRGEKISQVLIEKVYKVLLEEVHLRTSPYRASADYRKHLAKILLQDAIEIAWERAGDN